VGVLLVGAALAYGGAAWLYHSHSYVMHAAKGQKLLTENNTDQAIAELQTAVRQRPNFAAGHAALASAYAKKHDFGNAAAEMQRVIALEPQNEEAYYHLGVIYMEQNQPSKAEGAFAQLLKIDSNSADGHAGLANALAEQRRNLEALEEYKKTAALDGGYPAVYYNMGLCEARLMRYDDAIFSLVKQRQTADDAYNENLLAKVYESVGKQNEAEDARRRAARLQASH
jgi:tetratricopeptide (TPR) repeat protein